MTVKKEQRASFSFESVELKEKAELMARLQTRSLSNYINYLIKKDIEAWEKENEYETDQSISHQLWLRSPEGQKALEEARKKKEKK